MVNEHLRKDKEFKKLVESNEGYFLVSKYKNNKTKVKIYHEECGNTFEVVPTKFKFRGTRCPCLRRNSPKTHTSYIKEVEKNMGTNFKVLSQYEGIYEKVKVLHLDCNNTFETTARNLIAKGTCPFCKASKGEVLVRNILENNNIDFIEQYRDEKCKRKLPLIFDFYLPKHNIIIEYQGLQHYQHVKSFQSEKVFKEGQERDEIKRKFCKENNITLIEIPYWEKDVEKKLISQIINNQHIV